MGSQGSTVVEGSLIGALRSTYPDLLNDMLSGHQLFGAGFLDSSPQLLRIRVKGLRHPDNNGRVTFCLHSLRNDGVRGQICGREEEPHPHPWPILEVLLLEGEYKAVEGKFSAARGFTPLREKHYRPGDLYSLGDVDDGHTLRLVTPEVLTICVMGVPFGGEFVNVCQKMFQPVTPEQAKVHVRRFLPYW